MLTNILASLQGRVRETQIEPIESPHIYIYMIKAISPNLAIFPNNPNAILSLIPVSAQIAEIAWAYDSYDDSYDMRFL